MYSSVEKTCQHCNKLYTGNINNEKALEIPQKNIHI